jgi:hypothetical protein
VLRLRLREAAPDVIIIIIIIPSSNALHDELPLAILPQSMAQVND